jgi:hypothetical protein
MFTGIVTTNLSRAHGNTTEFATVAALHLLHFRQ